MKQRDLNYSLIMILTLIVTRAEAQRPFTTLTKEPLLLKKELQSKEEVYRAILDKESIIEFNKGKKSFLKEGESAIESRKSLNYFFKSNGLALNLIDKGENRISINSEVLHYKLYIANPTAGNEDRKFRYNIPLMVVSKLSSSYDSLGVAGAIDVLDYEAAPVTLRIMPSFKWDMKGIKDVFYYGFYADLRGVNVTGNDLLDGDMEFVGSGGLGITYEGDADAQYYNKEGEPIAGKYSISVILQGATGKKEVFRSLYKTRKNFATSLQSFLLVKVGQNNPLNLKIGYQYFFQKTNTGVKSNFSVNVGI